MPKIVTKTVVSPTTGNELDFDVPLTHEGSGYKGEVDVTFNGMELRYCNPEDSNEDWFELTWALARLDGNETSVEDDGELELYCPVCGEKMVFDFDEDEFEHLGEFDCGDAELIRDQPTESGQSHVINYRVIFD